MSKMLVLSGVAQNTLWIHYGRNSGIHFQLTKKDNMKDLS